MGIKFKLVVYNLLGLILLLSIPVTFTYNITKKILAEKQDIYTLIGNGLGFLVIDIIILVLMMFFFMAIDTFFKENISILGFFEHFTAFYKRSKIVNHSKLGKFLIICDSDDNKNKFYVYEVNYLYLRFVDYFYTNGNRDINHFKKCINIILDNEYDRQCEIQKDKERAKKLSDINYIKEWDGYLDLEGKRDDKINKILK